MTSQTQDQDIADRVRAITAQETGLPEAQLTDDLELRTVEGIDSVKVLRVVARIEREYDVELADEQVFACSSIADVAGAVRAALADGQGAP
jgi:acyl carrier protein